MKKRIRAFTIMELTIAMLISAIVIGITYTVYSIVSHSYNSFSGKSEDMALVARLDEWLKKDFDRAEIILKDTAGIVLHKNGELIKYKFDGDNVVRIGLKTDSFKIKNDSVSVLFENKIVSESTTSDEDKRLDEMDIQLLLQNEKITYHYHKVYSSANLIVRKPDAIH